MMMIRSPVMMCNNSNNNSSRTGSLLVTVLICGWAFLTLFVQLRMIGRHSALPSSCDTPSRLDGVLPMETGTRDDTTAERPLSIYTSATNTTNASSIPLTDDNFFQLVDPDRRASCGLTKCFLHARASEHDDDDDDEGSLGYLVSSTTRCRNQMVKMRGGWDMALHIARAYGAKHLFRDAPYEVQLSDATVQALRRVAFGLDDEETYRYTASRPVVVQHVTRAPVDSEVFNPRHRPERWHRFTTERVVDDIAFAERVSAEVERALVMIRDHALCCRDFQYLVDPVGNFWWLDLDRCFSELHNYERRQQDECITHLHWVRTTVWQMVSNSTRDEGPQWKTFLKNHSVI